MSDLRRWQSSPLYQPQRDDETRKQIAEAVACVLIWMRDVDPYRIEYHDEGCAAESVFAGDGTLLDIEVIESRNCPSCQSQWGTWLRLIDDGHLERGVDAVRAVQLARDVMEYGYSIGLLSEPDQELARIAIRESYDLKHQQAIQAMETERRRERDTIKLPQLSAGLSTRQKIRRLSS